jgi:hypothetical protein
MDIRKGITNIVLEQSRRGNASVNDLAEKTAQRLILWQQYSLCAFKIFVASALFLAPGFHIGLSWESPIAAALRIEPDSTTKPDSIFRLDSKSGSHDQTERSGEPIKKGDPGHPGPEPPHFFGFTSAKSTQR